MIFTTKHPERLVKWTRGTIHPQDIDLFNEAEDLAYMLAEHIGKQLKKFEHKRLPNMGKSMGLCYVEEKRIAIVVRERYPNDVKTHDPQYYGMWSPVRFKREVVMAVVAHEVAHLIHPNHSKEFRALERDLVKFAGELVGLDLKVSKEYYKGKYWETA